MTPRPTPEWVGSSPSAAIPDRVKLRIFVRDGGRCQLCTRKVGPGLPAEYDHTTALINGGEHREANIRLVCAPCHKAKTRRDVAEKAKTAAVRSKHLGIRKAKRPFPGSRSSGWKKRIDGTVERRT